MDHIGSRTLRDLVSEREQLHPDKTFVLFEAGDGSLKSLTYAETRLAIECVATGFARLGVRKGDRVVIKLSNSPELLFAWLAVAWIGAIAVPANVSNTPAEMEHVLDLSGADVVVSTSEELQSMKEAGLSVTHWIADRTSGAAEAATSAIADWMSAGVVSLPALEPILPEDVAQLLFTSGTTSRPKAVMLTHANYLQAGERESRTAAIDSSDRLLTALPLFHVNAQAHTVLGAMTVGGTAIVLEEYSARRFWAQVQEHRATHVCLVGMLLRTLLTQPRRPDDREHFVRRVVYALNVPTVEKEEFEDRFGVQLLNGYGLSEAMATVTLAPVFGPKRWPSIGLPALGREVKVVDDHGHEVPPGMHGEIVVKGVPGRSLMAGYFGDQTATDEALQGGWLHTGDTGYMDRHGYFYFVDRIKDVIKRAGENISSSEVEVVLVSHPAVKEAAVIGVPDPIRDEAVKAFLVLEWGSTVTPDELIAYCSGGLAPFKIPTEFEFVDSLPKTSVGKIRKKELRGAQHRVPHAEGFK